MAGKVAPGALPPPPTVWVGTARNLTRLPDEDGILLPGHLAGAMPSDRPAGAMPTGQPAALVAPGGYGAHQEPPWGWGHLTLAEAPFLANYTPQARAVALHTPVNFVEGPQGGYWAPQGLGLPQDDWRWLQPHLEMAQGLGGPAEATARHELGHMFDTLYAITSSELGPPPQGYDPNPNPFTEQAQSLHPSGNWDRPELGTIEQWGNPAELYAGMNQDPQSIPLAMRQYFPQFTPANYLPGPYQPRNTGRPEINDQAAPDWPTPVRPFMSAPANQDWQGRAWQDHWNYLYPQTEALSRQWVVQNDNPSHPPGPAPAGARWSWEYSNDGDPGFYWVLRPGITSGPS